MAVYQNEFIRLSLQESEKQELRTEFYGRSKEIYGMFATQRDVNLFQLSGELNVLEGIGVFNEKQAQKIRKEINETICGLGLHIEIEIEE